jgi:hypothetical protein
MSGGKGQLYLTFQFTNKDGTGVEKPQQSPQGSWLWVRFPEQCKNVLGRRFTQQWDICKVSRSLPHTFTNEGKIAKMSPVVRPAGLLQCDHTSLWDGPPI